MSYSGILLSNKIPYVCVCIMQSAGLYSTLTPRGMLRKTDNEVMLYNTLIGSVNITYNSCKDASEYVLEILDDKTLLACMLHKYSMPTVNSRTL